MYFPFFEVVRFRSGLIESCSLLVKLHVHHPTVHCFPSTVWLHEFVISTPAYWALITAKMNPRSLLLLLVGFMGGLSISFIRISLSTWGGAVGLRLPRSYTQLSRAPSKAADDAPAYIKPASNSKTISPLLEKHTVVAPKLSNDLPKICNNTDAMTEGPRDTSVYPSGWHIFQQSEWTPEEIPCYWTNLTHWQLTYYHDVPPIKMCTHDPEVDTVISSHLHKYGESCGPSYATFQSAFHLLLANCCVIDPVAIHL